MHDDIEKSREIARYLADLMTKKGVPCNQEFDQWIETNPSAFGLLERFADERRLEKEIQEFRSEDKVVGADEIMRRISRKQTRKFFVKISSVAAALIFVSFGFWYFTADLSTENSHETSFEMSELEENMKIVLENGEEIEWSSESDTVKTENLLFQRDEENRVTFISTGDLLTMNQFIVPQQKVGSIVLSDGTKVMLNAKSKLIFPNRFVGNQREVTIEGEGYFEVAKNDKIPFIVHSKNVAIQVYGTKFNINSYNNSVTETLLVEGSVGIRIGEKQHMLKPDQCSCVDENNGSVKVTDVEDLNKYLAWMNGYFIFEADKLEEVLNELSQWYNINLEIGENVRPDTPITGSFRRDTDLAEIIESLEALAKTKLLKGTVMKK